jgi:hypothetical protein
MKSSHTKLTYVIDVQVISVCVLQIWVGCNTQNIVKIRST